MKTSRIALGTMLITSLHLVACAQTKYDPMVLPKGREYFELRDGLSNSQQKFPETQFEFIGACEVAMTPADINRMGFFYPDMQLCPIPGRGNPPGLVHWLHGVGTGSGIGNMPTQVFEGSMEQPAGRLIFIKSQPEFFANPNGADGTKWLMGICRHSPQLLIGVCHVESCVSAITPGQAHCRIGIAKSVNGGDSWSYLGHVVCTDGDIDNWNIGGGPFAIKDGYFYIFYNRTGDQSAAVARTGFKELIAAAESDSLSAWEKYRDGQWHPTSAGDPAPTSSLNLPNIGNHNQMKFCPLDNNFYCAALGEYSTKTVRLYRSADLIHWTDLGALASGFEHLFYASMLDATGVADGTVGASFHVYFSAEMPESPPGDSGPGAWGKANRRGYYRVRIELKENESGKLKKEEEIE
jgi:hypothetical protein